MVAAEAAACGALPVVARHSGLGEVARTLAAAVPEPARAWLTFEVGPGRGRRARRRASPAGSPRPADLRAATREAIVAATRERYSWDGVARTVIAAARGELDDLPATPVSRGRRARRAATGAVRIPRRWRGDRSGGWRSAPAAAGALALLSGCGGLTDRGDNVVNGKQLFVAKCGSCHILNRAGTKGVTGPNLDAGVRPRPRGRLRREHLRGHRPPPDRAARPQPRRSTPTTGKILPLMPANLVKGEDARGRRGLRRRARSPRAARTPARWPRSAPPQAEGTARGRERQARDPGRPGRRARLHVRRRRGARPAQLEIDSPNESSVDHNIALEGGGVNEVGRGRQERRRLEDQRRRRRPASTSSSAPSPATARPAWRARSPSSGERRARRPRPSASCAARRKKKHSAKAMIQDVAA